MEKHKKLSQFLSFILRHHPEDIGLQVDERAWADVSELIEKINQNSTYKINLEILKELVESDEKHRYSFSTDETLIRANQGHSFSVDLGLIPIDPPEYLFHGTASRFLDSIMANGIQKQSRQYVHLSQDESTAEKVGKRHGNVCILKIKAKEMQSNGYKFYKSDNGVWLTDYVPTDYILI